MTIKEAKEKVIALAEQEIGYHEKKSKKDLDDKTKNSGSANYNKYAEWFDTKAKDFYNTKKNPSSWCDEFVDWLFCQVFGEAKAREMLYQPKKSLGAGCKYSAGYYRSNKAWYDEPELCDQIFFGTKGAESHTGVVIKVTDKMVYTVEGNADNQVKKKSYQRSNKKIAGYGRPKWKVVTASDKPSDSSASAKPITTTPATPKPTQGNSAKVYKVIAVHGLNLREKAGKNDNNKILCAMKYGSEVTATGKTTTVSGEPWIEATYTNKAGKKYTGWCCKKYLK